MKILMLIDSLVKGGREGRLIELLKAFTARDDVEIGLVIFSKKEENPEIYNLNFKFHFLESKSAKDPRVFYRFYKICKEERPDIIHSWGTMPSIYALPTAKLLGVKFINASIADAPLKLNIFDPRYFRNLITYPFSDKIVGNSKAGLKAYKAPQHKSYCVYNGFDFNQTKEVKCVSHTRSRYKILHGKVVGMVGEFFDRKDFNCFVEAACLYLMKKQDATFIAVGDGPNLEACKSKVPEYLKDRILFPGMVNDVDSLINVFDVGVLCTNSDVYGEGISNSILEYMVLGKPVIATRGGGTNEIVVDGKTGHLIPPCDPFYLMAKLMGLLDNYDLRLKFAKSGRQHVFQHFSLAKMTEDFLKLYTGFAPSVEMVLS